MCRDSKFQSHALETMLSIQKDKRYQVFDRVVGFHVGTYLSELELSKQLLLLVRKKSEFTFCDILERFSIFYGPFVKSLTVKTKDPF